MADVLELVDDRRFRLLGRANDLIHVAGRRSSLGYLNHHLNSIPGVEDGAFWLPDDVTDGVVRPVAFVVAPTLDAQAIVAALRDRIEGVFVPRLQGAVLGQQTAQAVTLSRIVLDHQHPTGENQRRRIQRRSDRRGLLAVASDPGRMTCSGAR